ncbi:phospholipid scramblase 2-like [Anopheles ziemanni]|uniref:phospholipid scramblase 2-like n=1 Tax=Anopheles coustani TaxID=139045 RepID=UPI00265890CA|nr:phospholipid scramblase 2-like [Anopheles coustani]XP_058178062.1 phospholipid scramblase 2-like [Anopheles ziemanni]
MSPPITTQPGIRMQPGVDMQNTGVMPTPTAIPHCPPGLENLYGAARLVMNLEIPPEFVSSTELVNKYKIWNTLGNVVYCAEEKASRCTRCCQGPTRAFDIKVTDSCQNNVLHFRRNFVCCPCCCFPCCLQKVEILLPSGTVLGTIEQKWTLWHPVFDIKDQHGQTVLVVRNCTPFGRCSESADVIFYVFSMDGTEIGKLTKKFVGEKYFSITFPMDLDVTVKATLLGTLFLLHYMFFEMYDKKQRPRPLCL